MKQFPSIPRVENAPADLLDSGHLWLQEKVDGANFRFRLLDDGVVEFGDRSRTYRDADEIPDPYRHAVRHVRERVDREALRRAVADVESVVCFGEAMHRHAVDYDWDRTPSFLGFDVWDGEEGRFLPPDAVEQVYDRLGLAAVNAFEKEVRATDFDPADYEVPESAWYAGPAEGVVVRNKTGGRAKLLHPEFREVDDTVPVEAPAEELADKYVTRHRIEKTAHKLADHERPVTFDAVFDRVVEDVVREEHKQLFHGDRSVDVSAFRSAAAELTQRFLDEERQ
ncbi:RNA ligase family protein [Halorussus litoreus]|uniref:RNA ligase family protein n=1 Tax=Halorussus litoreus TaxID=1710536 RepID=UPI000E225B5D|nr:RNA ligase family protein [Halorussus litoreus]